MKINTNNHITLDAYAKNIAKVPMPSKKRSYIRGVNTMYLVRLGNHKLHDGFHK